VPPELESIEAVEEISPLPDEDALEEIEELVEENFIRERSQLN
jgi:hypothetical protein